MADSYGDGWNGNNFVITDADGNSLFSATINFGTSASDTFTLDNNEQLYISVNGGSWQAEVSWDFFSSGSVFSIGETGSQGIVSDVLAGWYQLSMSDSWGDGWNGNTWTLKDGATTVAGPFGLI